MAANRVTTEMVEAMYQDAIRRVRDDGFEALRQGSSVDIGEYDAARKQLRTVVLAMPGGEAAWRDWNNDVTAKRRYITTGVHQRGFTRRERPIQQYEYVDGRLTRSR